MSSQMKAYMYMIWMVIFCLAADIASRMYNYGVGFFRLSVAGTYLKYSLLPMCIMLYFNYVSLQVPDIHRKRLTPWRIVLWMLLAVNIVLTFTTGLTGWIFSYDSSGQYHRGPFQSVSMIIMILMAAVIELFIIGNKRSLSRTYYSALFWFYIPPLIGGILQTLVYGMPLALIGVSASYVAIYINVLHRDKEVDYLTGAFTRDKIDSSMDVLIRTAGTTKGFSVVMIDVDKFKVINDRLGHAEGDRALKDAVRILRRSVRQKDFVGRYGGDEFCIISDITDADQLKNMVGRVEQNLESFSKESARPYALRFSMGYAIYTPGSGLTANEFLRFIDGRMYAAKEEHHLTDFSPVKQTKKEPLQ